MSQTDVKDVGTSSIVPLKNLIQNSKRVIQYARPLSTKANPLVDMVVDNDGIAVVTLQRPPVNSLNLDLLQAINNTFDDVAKNKSKGMILTSASPTIFSAGLDILELYKPDPKRIETLWVTLQDVWLKLFGATYPTAAAVKGHAPAGGCLLAISCEYRVMLSGKFNIGLNETALGMVTPIWFQDSLSYTIPTRQAEIALTTGKLFTVDEALKVGLVDETAADKAEAIDKCKKFIKRFDKIPPLARGMTKQIFRQEVFEKLKANRQADTKQFLDLVTQPEVQKSIELYLAMLKQKSQK